MMAISQTNHKARRYLGQSLVLPALFAFMWYASPANLHWHHCFYADTFGFISWIIIAFCGICGHLDPWLSVVLVLEFVFGVVPVVYVIADYPRTGMTLPEKLYQTRVVFSIPVVLMAKQIGRATVDLAIDGSPNAWWHFPVDLIELLSFVVAGYCMCSNIGEIWFLIYTGIPAALSSFLMDYMVGRVKSLLRANARLMQTTFAAVIHADVRKGGKILADSPGLSKLMATQTTDFTLETMVTANKKQLDFLCSASPSKDGEQVFRRLMTTLLAKDRSWYQDVELRCIAVTEQEALKENGVVQLGVVVVGERVPLLEAFDVSPSTLMEQSLDNVGHVRVVDSHDDSQSATASQEPLLCNGPETTRMKVRPSSVLDGLRNRRTYNSTSVVSSSYASESASAADAAIRRAAKFAQHSSSSEPSSPYAKWQNSTVYTKECSSSILEDLIATWNFEDKGCCSWHNAVRRLASMVDDMAKWHTCEDNWPDATEEIWQCHNCMAVQRASDLESACWVCCEPQRPSEKAPFTEN